MPRPDQRAAGNKPPKDGVGLTRKLDETNEKTRQSDGVRQTGPRALGQRLPNTQPLIAIDCSAQPLPTSAFF